MTGMIMRAMLATAMIVLVSLQSSSGQESLSLVRTIDLPRVEGRIDHLAIDLAGQRLFVAALGNNTVEVVDLKTGTVVKSMRGFHEPQGLQVVPDAKSVAVANAETGDVQWLDGADYRVTRTTPLGNDADNVRYDAGGKRVYVGYGNGAIAAIGAADGKVQGEAKLTA